MAEKISTVITWCIAILMAWLGDLSLKDISTVAGLLVGILMAFISWYYKRKTYQLLASGRISREVYESATR
ncbi:HP1 family phage holin [Erwinia billingiae]|uniref:HP1 family phage holin n=1 Tax=Erwinia billingiae TaxID=182337 RepID=UPI003207F059